MVRQRSEEAHRKVVHAAIRLFAKQGIDATSMDLIADADQVSAKPRSISTGEDKDALALEALSQLYGLHEEFPDFASGNLRKDLIDCLSYESSRWPKPPPRERMMSHLMAYSARNQAFGRAWREEVHHEAPPCRACQSLSTWRSRRPALQKNLDFDLSTALLFGPMLYRYIFDTYVKGEAHV